MLQVDGHSFVAAKLSPSLSTSTNTSAKYGRSVLPSFATKPFLALHLQLPDRFTRDSNFFVVSTQQPTLPNSEYLVLNSNQTESESNGTLTVVPPLPFKGPLYLLVTPRISASFGHNEAYKRLVNAEKYQLDKPSLERFLETLEKAGPSILAPAATRETGGSDEPVPNWDSWSEYSCQEDVGVIDWHPEVYFIFHFDLIPFDSLPTDPGLHVFDELPLLRQLKLDYTWRGCELVFQYFESMRKTRFSSGASDRIIRLPDLPTRQPDPSVDALLPSTRHLQSLPVVYDGDPHVAREEDMIPDDLKDQEPLDLLSALPWAIPIPAVKANSKDINVIALDSGLLIDRDGPLQDALTRIFPVSQHQFAPKELLDLYIEYETFRSAHEQSASPTAIVQDVASYLSISVNEFAINTALEDYAKSRLYPETPTILASFIEQGYSLLVLPSLGSSSNDLALLPQLPGLSLLSSPVASDSPVSWKWEPLLQNYRTLQRNQILVVTSDIYHTVEPATEAGFPTAFISNPVGSRSATLLSITPTPPTFTFTTLAELLQALKDGVASMPDSQDPEDVALSNLLGKLRDIGRRKSEEAPNGPLLALNAASRTSAKASRAFKHFFEMLSSPPRRIYGCYHMESRYKNLLGSGSFAGVHNGIQVRTGAEVAIKFELKSEILPYEAAVYAQLKGVPGVPRVHWSGAEKDAYMIVMDKLGPNLDQLRRVCRGRFGLRTVLMLGEQMLSIIEEVHARGIIVRDIKPQNFAMGFMEDYKRLYLLDFGLSKLWLDPTAGKHIPFRESRGGIGTARYASYHYHLGSELSRRDDLEAIGFVLLHLLHGRLPWQGIGRAQDISEKYRIMGEIKLNFTSGGKWLTDLLLHEPDTPEFLIELFKHCRGLGFEDKPDYRMLRRLIRAEFESRGWGEEYDWEYDWWTGNGERGTLLTEEYKFDPRLVWPARREQPAW